LECGTSAAIIVVVRQSAAGICHADDSARGNYQIFSAHVGTPIDDAPYG
jgi:hypothetical protein